MQNPQIARAPPGSALTNREQEVLELLAFGLSNKEIAQRLQLSPRTVETHIDRVLGKLNASTRTRAVVEAGRAGLLRGSAANAAPHFEARPNNLPFQLTALLGREQELADVELLLQRNRLLTLSGSGGVGKTRLALRVGVDVVELQADGIWFCDFSPLTDPALVSSVVAKTLRVRERAERPLSDSIVQNLRRKNVLLIFDNCEHVIDSAAEIADEILHDCPNVRILATSRQPLGIIGEVVHRLRSLAVPESFVGLTSNAAKEYGAIALFVDRAQAANASFALTDANAPIVATICRRLDGIPLAIELAAARVNVISIDNLAQSLDDRFKVLTGGSRTALPRHKTLEALVDWSYDRLPPKEQQLFARLGVFAGGFTLEAARVVCASDHCDDANLLDCIIALVDKSLVVTQTGGLEERCRLLETTRAYALQKLELHGERARLERRHREYFRDRAAAADKKYGMGSTAVWLTEAEADLENYRAALEWALRERNDIPLGAAIAGALERLWSLGGLSSEARLWIDLALEELDELEHPGIAARLWLAKARFLQGQPMHDCAHRAFVLYQTTGDRRGAGYALRSLAYSLLQMGQVDEANDVIAQAISQLRELGDKVGVASCLGLQGVNAYNRRDYSNGRQFYLQALAIYRELDDELSAANALGNLAELEFADGRHEEALKIVSESLAITSRGKETTELAIDHNNMAAYRIAIGDLEQARRSAREALRWAQPEQNAWNTAVALQHFALLAALDGQTDRAAHLLGYVNAQYRDLALEREATEQWGYEKLLAALREKTTDGNLERLAAEGATWPEERAVDEALAI